MAIEYRNQPRYMAHAIEYANIIFSILYFVEALIKISAYGLTYYLKFTWNKFDFFLAILSGIDLAMNGIADDIASNFSWLFFI